MKPEQWASVKRLLQSALERPLDEREAFLQLECAGDDTLLHEVQSLVAAGAEADSFLDTAPIELKAGTRLGSYEIIAMIGAGGMGEVYRARDSRIGRDVAIKRLPESFGHDPNRLRRFEREARLAGSLNHPNLITIYDVGAHDDTPFVVMELLKGHTLREEVGRLSIRKAIDYAIQIATGLAAAHEQGIIHRDLKPENIFVTDDGRVKILDFGLAKTISSTSESSAGIILGTAPYMSPEQVSGETVDVRSDIFSFGVVLYEMLSGRHPFKRGSTIETMHAIVTNEVPDLANVSPFLNRIALRCLEKKPAARFQSARDTAYALEAPEGPAGESVKVRRKNVWRAWVSAGVGATFMIAALVALIIHSSHPRSIERRVISLMIDDSPLSTRNGLRSFDLSPDGTALVFAAGNPPRLHLRKFSEAQSAVLAGTENASAPFFSPDGRWIGFVSSGTKLMRVPTSGGESQFICDANWADQPKWTARDQIVLVRNEGVLTVPVAGGAATIVYRCPREARRLEPTFDLLPGNRVLIVLVWGIGSSRDRTIALVDLSTGSMTKLVNGSHPKYSPTGHLLFERRKWSAGNGTIYGVSFDLDRRRLTGPITPRVTGVQFFMNGGHWTITRDGSLVYLPFDPASVDKDLVWIDQHGTITSTYMHARGEGDLALARDGSHVAFSDLADIWVQDLSRDVRIRLTKGDGEFIVQTPRWSPDGRFVAYQELREGGDVNVVSSDGSSPPRRISHNGRQPLVSSWSPDGKMIAINAFMEGTHGRGRGRDIWMIDVGTGAATPFGRSGDTEEESASFSPDARWVAYVSSDVSQSSASVRVERFPEQSGVQTIATASCSTASAACFTVRPTWSADGRELFFRSGDEMMAVDIDTTGAQVKAGKPRTLFKTDVDDFDVASDGRFIGVKSNAEPRWDHLNMVTGWWNDVPADQPR